MGPIIQPQQQRNHQGRDKPWDKLVALVMPLQWGGSGSVLTPGAGQGSGPGCGRAAEGVSGSGGGHLKDG